MRARAPKILNLADIPSQRPCTTVRLFKQSETKTENHDFVPFILIFSTLPREVCVKERKKTFIYINRLIVYKI